MPRTIQVMDPIHMAAHCAKLSDSALMDEPKRLMKDYVDAMRIAHDDPAMLEEIYISIAALGFQCGLRAAKDDD